MFLPIRNSTGRHQWRTLGSTPTIRPSLAGLEVLFKDANKWLVSGRKLLRDPCRNHGIALGIYNTRHEPMVREETSMKSKTRNQGMAGAIVAAAIALAPAQIFAGDALLQQHLA